MSLARRLLGAGKPWGTALQALRYLGKDGVDARVIRRLHDVLSADDRSALARPAAYVADWLRPVIAGIAGRS